MRPEAGVVDGIVETVGYGELTMVLLMSESEDELRARLRKMDDAALRRYGTAAREMMNDPKNPKREIAETQHRVAQEVWREKHTSQPNPRNLGK